jgi:leucyl/phenylalanyl-tRNA---protein transferase
MPRNFSIPDDHKDCLGATQLEDFIMPIPWLNLDDFEFPSIDQALSEPDGLLAAGGDLKVQRLLQAYQNGIFPWYEDGQPILWWSPNPRMVLRPEDLKISKSLHKLLRRNHYTLSMDQDFAAVIQGCAEARRDATGTWITDEMQAAYCALHAAGFAHSVEVWSQQELVGGLYGVALGEVFFGESMFSREANTSKLALVSLVKQLQQWKYKLIDCQVSSEHLLSLGAKEISREQFRKKLLKLRTEPGKIGPWQLELARQTKD